MFLVKVKQNSILVKIKQNPFLKSSLTLLLGSASARFFPILLTPFLTRLYRPEDFGVLALFLSIVSIASVFSTGRYDMAIMLPNENKESEAILNLALLLTISFSIILFVIFYFLSNDITRYLGNRNININTFLYLVPLNVVIISFIRSFTYFNNRLSKYKLISITTVLQSFSTVLIQIILGFKQFGSLGLIVGSILGSLFALLFIVKKSVEFSKDKSLREFDRLLNLAKRYKKFLIVSSWGALLDTISVQLPIFFITKMYSTDITGIFSFTFRIINLPMALISNSIMQVFLKEVTELHRRKPEKITKIVIKVTSALLIIVTPMVVILFCWGGNLFSIVFGYKWNGAGAIAGTLSVAAGIRFIVSPLSSVLIIEKHINKGVLWKAFYFLSSLVMLSTATRLPFNEFLKIFVIHELILYILYFLIILYAARAEEEEKCVV